jgi:CRISPR-associated endonuclease/helicase Cas3
MTDDFTNSFRLISHTEPTRKLVVHLDEVYKKAKQRFDQLDINFETLSVSKDEFEQILRITVLCHDFGKASTFFQEKIRQEVFTTNVKLDKLSQHGLISAFFGYFVALEKFGFDRRLSSLIFMAIRSHHLDLRNAEDMQEVKESEIKNVLLIFDGVKQNGNEVDKIYSYFFGIDNIICEFASFLEGNFSHFRRGKAMFFWYKQRYEKNDIFIFLLLFSLLIYADKEDAIFRDAQAKALPDLHINSQKVEEFKADYFKRREKTPLDEIREKIYQKILDEFNSNGIKNKKVFFIELPTGAGKTLLLYKLALQIKEEQKYQKVFYLLPFITLIEQNATILKDLLAFMEIVTDDNRLFLEKHSLGGEFIISGSNDEYDIDKKQFLLDTLESEFTVTSFHQLFYGVFKRKNALLKRFHQFSNSIILIDEVQLIPLELMYPLTQFLKFMSEIFNCKIIVASATFPNIKKDLLGESHTFKTINDMLDPQENEKFFNRYLIVIDIIKSYDIESLYTKIDKKIATNKDLLFRVNTVNTANDIYAYLMSKKRRYKKENIFLLTSAIAPIDRKKIIEKIKYNSKNGIKQIVVATQLIQAGVDISLEDGFEELAPFDLIIQSMGRRNRSAEKDEIGSADIIKIVNKNGYEGYKIYNHSDIDQTVKILRGRDTLTEQQIYKDELLSKYYNAQVEIRSIDHYFERLNFQDIDDDFVLIPQGSFSVSFFIPLDKKARTLWDKLVKLDSDKKAIEQDKDFWKNMKIIENEYSKIKKDINSYVVNQNLYYSGDKKEAARAMINDKFEKALDIYLATEDVFDKKLGLQLTKYLKGAMEGLFW